MKTVVLLVLMACAVPGFIRAETTEIEVVAEPFLVREGLIARTPRGRVATPLAWEHLGLTPPDPAAATGLSGPGTLFDEESGR